MHRRPRIFAPALAAFCLTSCLTAPLSAAEPGALTGEQRAELVELLVDSRAEIERLVGETPPGEWATKLAPDRWSVSEVVEHLVLAETRLRGWVTEALASDPDPDWESVAARTTIGQLVGQVSDRSQRFQAPDALEPEGGMARDEALLRFSGERAVTLDLVRSTEAPLARHTAPGRGGEMNAIQLLALIGAHTERHAQQIEEILEELGGGGADVEE